MTLELLPLVKEDADEVVQLNIACYENNPFRRILFPSSIAQSSFDIIRDGQLKAVDDPNKYALKVVDTDTGEIAASAVWAYTQAMTDEDWDRERQEALKPYPEAREEVLLEFVYKEQDSKRIIMGHTRWWGKYCPCECSSTFAPTANSLHPELVSLNTLPKYQRRGIGSMLLRWGIDKQEEIRVPSFIISTDQGYGLYMKHGYREIERWEIDMGRWPQWGGNGLYKNVFLTRYPAEPAQHETGGSEL